MALFATTWRDFVTAGDIAAIATLALLVVGLRFVYKGGGSEAVRILRDSNEVLAERVRVLELQLHVDTATIAELKTKTDVATLLQPVLDWQTRSEQRDQERFERTLLVLDRIAERLGPDL